MQVHFLSLLVVFASKNKSSFFTAQVPTIDLLLASESSIRFSLSSSP